MSFGSLLVLVVAVEVVPVEVVVETEEASNTASSVNTNFLN